MYLSMSHWPLQGTIKFEDEPDNGIRRLSAVVGLLIFGASSFSLQIKPPVATELASTHPMIVGGFTTNSLKFSLWKFCCQKLISFSALLRTSSLTLIFLSQGHSWKWRTLTIHCKYLVLNKALSWNTGIMDIICPKKQDISLKLTFGQFRQFPS